MSSRNDSNFDLSIERAGDHYRARVMQSSAGEGSVEFELAFEPRELENLLLRIGQSQSLEVQRGSGFDSDPISAAKALGTRLFQAVFQGDVYARLLSTLERGGEARILLRLPPDLAALPWEYLYYPLPNRFLALSRKTPLVRYLDLIPSVSPLDVQLPLRVLVAISSPNDYDPLDVEREWDDLQTSLGSLLQSRAVQIDRIENPSLLSLRHQLHAHPCHILHFIGHGAFNEQRQDGALIFCDERGRGRPVSGQSLGTILHDYNTLRLVLLNACEGARGSRNDPFAGVAQSLVQMGLPAAIAMQSRFSDAAARLFTREFYLALADGQEVDVALSDARQAIYANDADGVEWATPVLFTRSADGQIFDLAPAAPAEPAPHPTTSSPADLRHSQSSESLEAPPSAGPKNPPDFGGSTASPGTQAPDLVRLYEDGLSAFHLENWPRAVECFQAVLAHQPGYRDVTERLAQARQQIDLGERYHQTLVHLKRRDWPAAVALLEKLAAEAPAYRDVNLRLAAARQQVQLQALYADAARQSQAGEWAAVIVSFTQIQKLQADYPDPHNLLARARAQLQEQERTKKLDELYTSALQALGNQRWEDAERILLQIEKLSPGHRDAPRLLEKARAELARQKSAHGSPNVWGWLAAHRQVVGAGLVGLCVILFGLSRLGLPGATPSPTDSTTITFAPATISTTTTFAPATVSPTIPPATDTPTPPTVTPTRSPFFGMEPIPAGTFKMGSVQGQNDEKPIHQVTLNAFWMDKYEVTNAEYARCVADKKCSLPGPTSSRTRKSYYGEAQYADYPVIFVSWEQAKSYCEWRGARLPSEAEWEWAARGGLEDKTYPWGDEDPVCTLGAKNGVQFDRCSPKDTIAVGSFQPNGYGLYDMVGNAWEWVNDWYGGYSTVPISNPTGPTSGQNRMVRGGGWSYILSDLRMANRTNNPPTYRDDNSGFRCASSLP